MENRKLVEAVYRYNPPSFNVVCCIEEMSELTKVLTKKLRNSPKFNRENLLEEVSHVLLMCNVIAYANKITDEEILAKQILAVDRMYEDK